MSTHSTLSPSAAHRWAVCTASVGYIVQLREQGTLRPDTTSVFADEGTKAHEIAGALLSGVKLTEFPEDGWPSLDSVAPVCAYVDFVRGFCRPDDTLMIERKFSLFYRLGDYGTADAVLVGRDRIAVLDLKYGVGVSIAAERNKQLAIYAESLVRELEAVEPIPVDHRIELYIFQPRDRQNPEPVRAWLLTRGELAEFCAGIERAANDVLQGLGVFVANPDEQCRFCPAKGLCRAHAEYAVSGFTDLSLDEAVAGTALTEVPDVLSLTREQRIRVVKARPALEKWMAQVEMQEIKDLQSGAPLRGLKLVEGSSHRRWTDPEAVKKLLRNHLSADQVCPPSDPVSPAQAEKLLKGLHTSTRFDNRLAALITKPQGKPTLVAESDPRTALVTGPDFPDLTSPAHSESVDT